ncbi:hypothetical protein C8N43_0289 [Litoreibacter ponti]|uniref:UrcA family protein n=1 Tax=Litoreibacter ponti TaxID=1510457 RepID=A0A2T6BHW2_9RHOB|nr:hypothetical protein [Litoreibacter ponti]PTX55650.1 hypothetical protein C8N43_0289 [Litoreibacter ponti]
MKIILTAALTTLAFSAPIYAETSAEELFAMSNESAAEILVREHSLGDMKATQVAMALESMSAAERRAFFDSTPASRMEVLECMHKTDSGDSPAEACAIK